MGRRLSASLLPFFDAANRSTRACEQFCGTTVPAKYRLANAISALVLPFPTSFHNSLGSILEFTILVTVPGAGTDREEGRAVPGETVIFETELSGVGESFVAVAKDLESAGCGETDRKPDEEAALDAATVSVCDASTFVFP